MFLRLHDPGSSPLRALDRDADRPSDISPPASEQGVDKPTAALESTEESATLLGTLRFLSAGRSHRRKTRRPFTPVRPCARRPRRRHQGIGPVGSIDTIGPRASWSARSAPWTAARSPSTASSRGSAFARMSTGWRTGCASGGFIKNVSGGVLIEVEGEPHCLDRFLAELTAQPPPLARIDDLRWSSRPAFGDPSFRIETSDSRRRQPDLHLPRCGDLRRLPGRAVRSPRSPLPLPVPQLHQLRPPADDHHRFALRPRADEHGLVRHVPASAAPSTTTPAIAASTPSPRPARSADPGSSSSIRRGRSFPASIRSPAAVDALQARPDRCHQGAGRLSPGLRRGPRGGRGRTAQPEAPR